MRGFRRPRLPLAIALLSVGWVCLSAPASLARVNPLLIIQRQLHKANMLIVLDTSGSMTGVPGGQFDYPSEVGVDCDNGSDCRMGGVLGVCNAWARTCMSDDDCRHGYCSKDGVTICATTSECTQDPGTCSAAPTVSCTDDTQCTPLTGTCSITEDACTSGSTCPAAGRCKYTQAACSNPGGSCANVTVCAATPTRTCATANDCPHLGTTGTCKYLSTPRWGCTDDGDCPNTKYCSVDTRFSCHYDTDCPLQDTGTCLISKAVCNGSNRRCSRGDTCVYPGQTCTGAPNECLFTPDTCVTKTDNTCIAAANTCSAPANTCVLPPTNTCIPPASTTDVCNPDRHGTPGPIRMCRLSQTVCTRDSDCTTTGDACGPATSRAVVAKRAIADIVNNNHKMLNFGLMTFYQKGYFPYFLSSGSSTGTTTYFARLNEIARSHCWDNHAGPRSPCTINGIPMTLRASANSRYRVRTAPSVWILVDNDWCGHTCDMPGALGLGHFMGAYYEYSGRTGGTTSSMIVQPSYTGQSVTVNSKTYTYYQPLTDYYNSGKSPPLDFGTCDRTCTSKCGGRWDTQLAPFLDTSDDETVSQAAATAISQAMAPAATGGLIFYWGTPTGCTLENDGAKTIRTSAYDYMSAVKNGNTAENIAKDHLTCRDNYVLLITDGAANGPGDDNCDATACAASDPVTAGCSCRSVLAAYHLRKNLGVRTFVVGFSGDTSAGPPRTINDNIARAGGTDASGDGVAPFAYLAQDEETLNSALQLVIYEAVKGSYSTAPTSTSAGTQQSTTVAEGKYALDSRMDFPEWKGHLLAYDLSGTAPVLAWDAYQKMIAGNWWQRRIYTWDGTNMVKIAVDPTTHAITNKSALTALGMGSSDAESENVARWLLGDPLLKNPAILGAIINSTPIDVASPGDIPEPGGHAFFVQHQNRPHLVYVGSSDAMLHAFFLENTTIASTSYPAGSEAFAFLPPDMIPVVRKQYSQGGQKPDPYSHIFGLADSPKAKTLCVRNCSDASTAEWKTLLIMPEGYGGRNIFALDVTAPFSATGLAEPPVRVQWHSGYGSDASNYGTMLGNTISLPALFFNKTAAMDEYRAIFTSGYPVTEGSTTQGRYLITASAATGAISTSTAVAPTATCTQEYAALTDVATARDFAKSQSNKLVAAYFGDTSGQLFRYTLGGGVTTDQSFTCDYPLHYSPTVVQLDRDSLDTAHGHEIYPVQVTNSNLDEDTTTLPPSKLVFWKEVAHVDTTTGAITSISKDTSWGTGGTITLTAGNGNEICAVTQVEADGRITCKDPMPAGARPTSTPIGLLLKDANGFQVMTTWYMPAVDGCTRGRSFLTIHQVSATGGAAQRFGAIVANEPVTSPVVLGGHVYVFGSSGAIDITRLVPDTISAGRATPPSNQTAGYIRFDWREVY